MKILLLALICLSSAAFADTYQKTCTSSTSVVSTAKNSRKIIMIMNQGATAALICYSGTCTTLTGFQLQADAALTDPFHRGAISCITAGGSTTLGVIEE